MLNFNVLPEPGPAIHLLFDQPDLEVHNYQRIRLQYHLLPHNIYNYGSVPKKRFVGKGDYILVLGANPDLRFEPHSGKLRWQKNFSVSVEKVDGHAQGSVFRVKEGTR